LEGGESIPLLMAWPHAVEAKVRTRARTRAFTDM
jgi:hypothetical protein